MSSSRNIPGAELCRPLPLAGLALMALNDHLLRVRWPGLVTGKISDLAVLLYLPGLLAAFAASLLLAWNALARRLGARELDAGPTRARILAACFLSGLALVLLKLSPAARDLYVHALAAIDFVRERPRYRLELDPTDLVALVVLPLAVLDGLACVRRAEAAERSAP